jgi:predicted nucleotidyltransferase
MRLTQFEISSIKECVAATFGDAAKILLFGSRVDDAKRGGDIDLLVVSNQPFKQAFRAKIKAIGQIQMKIGEQKIDMVVTADPSVDSRLVVTEAMKQGELL